MGKHTGPAAPHRYLCGGGGSMTTEELDKLSRLPIKGTDPAELVDLSTVSITGDTPAQRLDSYLTQVKNPYLFRVGNTPVKISFPYNCDEKPLLDRLKSHLLSLKSCDSVTEV